MTGIRTVSRNNMIRWQGRLWRTRVPLDWVIPGAKVLVLTYRHDKHTIWGWSASRVNGATFVLESEWLPEGF